MNKPVLIGIGNDLNGDDAAGPYVAESLSTKVKNITVMNAGTQPDNFTGKLMSLKPSHVIIVDAAMVEGEAGSIAPVSLNSIDDVCFHTHYLPLGRIVERIVDKCGCKVLVIGIKPLSMEPGDGLSLRVKETADILISKLIEYDSQIHSG